MDSFQDVLFKLKRYWGERGCVIQEPYDVEVGAGTMAPETFLRVLGTQPYRVAYVQPSRRPADGRYGENPNRLYKHSQLQVILKPSPADVMDQYLASLAAIGIDLDLVPAELTYGLERLTAFLQGKDSVYDIEWAPGVGYGDVRLAEELQFSVYNFEMADVATLWKLFELHEKEGRRLLDAWPEYPRKERFPVLAAYDQVLKCSHLFNLLDSRGAISVTERVATIGRIRKLAQGVARCWLDQSDGGAQVAVAEGA